MTKEIDLFDRKHIRLVDVVTTYQGEGPNCGKRMTLTRFKYCNKACPFCDTQKMMTTIPEKEYSLEDISKFLDKSNGLMITGGEPTLDVKSDGREFSNFESTILMLKYLNYNWADVETNGCNLMKLIKSTTDDEFEYKIDGINISWSPKFITKDDYDINLYNARKAYNWFGTIRPILKIVISKEDNEYKKFLYDVVTRGIIPGSYIYLMPLGVTYDEINYSMDECLKVASELCCNISSRLQIIHKFP